MNTGKFPFFGKELGMRFFSTDRSQGVSSQRPRQARNSPFQVRWVYQRQVLVEGMCIDAKNVDELSV